MISPGLATILRSGRADFNARFLAARRLHPDLDPAAFAGFLESAVDELAQAVEQVRPDRLGEVVQVAYDAGLELVGQKLAGAGARLDDIEQAWREILPAAAGVVAGSPGRLIPAVCNAAHQLASTPGASCGKWIERMTALIGQCADADGFARLGQVLAWRAGLPHLRAGALEVAGSLPESLALAAVEAGPGAIWNDVRAKLLAQPWFDPSRGSAGASASMRVVAQAGTFKGFGGLFIEPPSVVSAGDHFLVRSDRECWLLTADLYGATFHRASIEEFAEAERGRRGPPRWRFHGSRVECDGVRFESPILGEIAGVAANATTLAITTRLTHSVVLVALG